MKNLLAAALVGMFSVLALAAEPSYTIAVIPKGNTHEFWKSIHAGAVKAEQELGAQGIKVNLFWKGPLREDDRDQQIQVVENFTSRQVSGIVLAPLDSQALVAPWQSRLRRAGPCRVVAGRAHPLADVNNPINLSRETCPTWLVSPVRM